MGEVQGYSFKCCVELDHALTKKSEEEIIDEIGGKYYYIYKYIIYDMLLFILYIWFITIIILK